MPAVSVDGHTIDVSVNRLSGKEHVHFDGEDVSSERNLTGIATHSFTVEDHGTTVAYEVDTSNEVLRSVVSAVRRDGTTVYPTG